MDLATGMTELDFADVFVCDGTADWHGYYYIAPSPVEDEGPWCRVNRTGIERRLPAVFYVERRETTRFCQLFCIFSGRGLLHYRGRDWPLQANQVVLLCAGEPHSYRSDPVSPLGMSWVEFCGGNSQRLVRHILERQPPVLEGDLVRDITTQLADLQQKLMLNERYQPGREIYQLLWQLRYGAGVGRSVLEQDLRRSFRQAESYIDAHLRQAITNGQLAQLVGVSEQYFTRKFKEIYRCTPQMFIMGRRITRAKYLLTQTTLPVETVSELLGFCNPSHFIRRFRGSEQMTPAAYRRTYCLYPVENEKQAMP